MFALEAAALVTDLFDEPSLRRLSEFTDLHVDVMTGSASVVPRGAERTELLITGWGAPPLDATILEALPNLRAVFHAAGSVK